MLIATVPAAAFDENCYVVAAGPGQECLVIDPGIGVLDQLDEVVAARGLHPAAVLLTHGHVDHVFSVAPICGTRGITAYVHPGDRELLADPAKGLSTQLTMLFAGRLPYTEPERVEPLPDGAPIEVAGIQVTVDHAPGHSAGSVLLRVPGRDEPICFSGDVLFAGSIGRTDLPGGDPEAMAATLRDKVLTLPDETVVLPGHGPRTTIARERAGNPYLQNVARVSPKRGW